MATDMITALARPVAGPSVDRLDRLFKAFADPTRLRILNLLAAGELRVGDIVDILDLPQPTVSRQLAYMRGTGLVEARREWKFVHYRLSDPEHPVHRNLINCVRTCFRGIRSLDKERARAETRHSRVGSLLSRSGETNR